jgi:outer membrane lipoprotein LolB
VTALENGDRPVFSARVPFFAAALVYATAVSLTSGCAAMSMKSEKSRLAWEARRELLSRLDQFTLQARVSSGGVFGVKGNLHWRQQGDAFDLRVAGPFGVGAASITGRGRQVQIRTAKGTFETDNPEADLQERLGWTFPLTHLRYWVLGTPAPGSGAEVDFDRHGRLTRLEQDDWTLEVDEYQAVGTLELPRKFEVANSEVRIKVVVDAWSDLPHDR